MLMLTLMSSLLLAIPPVIGNFEGSIEKSIQLCMIVIVFTSLWFWNSPVRKTLRSKVDSRIVKTTILVTLVYALMFKELHEQQRNMLITCLIGLGIAWYNSKKYAILEWCSSDHLVSHYFVHLFGVMTTLVIF